MTPDEYAMAQDRLSGLERKLAARHGVEGFTENAAALQAEIDRLTAEVGAYEAEGGE